MQSSEDSAGAVALLIRPALLTVSACVRNRLETSAVSHLQCLYIRTNLDDDTGTLVASAFCAKVGHLSKTPISLHEMKI